MSCLGVRRLFVGVRSFSFSDDCDGVKGFFIGYCWFFVVNIWSVVAFYRNRKLGSEIWFILCRKLF